MLYTIGKLLGSAFHIKGHTDVLFPCTALLFENLRYVSVFLQIPYAELSLMGIPVLTFALYTFMLPHVPQIHHTN